MVLEGNQMLVAYRESKSVSPVYFSLSTRFSLFWSDLDSIFLKELGKSMSKGHNQIHEIRYLVTLMTELNTDICLSHSRVNRTFNVEPTKQEIPQSFESSIYTRRYSLCSNMHSCWILFLDIKRFNPARVACLSIFAPLDTV